MREGSVRNQISKYFLDCKGLSNDDVGVTRGTVFREVGSGAGFKNRIFRERKVDGATKERLYPIYYTLSFV